MLINNIYTSYNITYNILYLFLTTKYAAQYVFKFFDNILPPFHDVTFQRCIETFV